MVVGALKNTTKNAFAAGNIQFCIKIKKIA